MTREEFTVGWSLFLAQPWGKGYRPDEDEVRARLQFELYWKRFHHLNPFLWQAVCETYAGGKGWPGMDALHETINLNTRREVYTALPAPSKGGDAPDDYCVRLGLRRWIAGEGSIYDLVHEEFRKAEVAGQVTIQDREYYEHFMASRKP